MNTGQLEMCPDCGDLQEPGATDCACEAVPSVGDRIRLEGDTWGIVKAVDATGKIEIEGESEITMAKHQAEIDVMIEAGNPDGDIQAHATAMVADALDRLTAMIGDQDRADMHLGPCLMAFDSIIRVFETIEHGETDSEHMDAARLWVDNVRDFHAKAQTVAQRRNVQLASERSVKHDDQS